MCRSEPTEGWTFPTRGIVAAGWHDIAMNADAELYAVAANQGGVVRRDQALMAGLTRHQIDGRVRSGQWIPVARGGYRLIDLTEATDIVRAAVAVLPSAVVSHFSAARIHKMSFAPIDHASVTVHSRTTHRFSGVQVFRCLDMRDRHITTWQGLPMTTLERTVVDLASVVSERRLAVIVDDLLAGRRTTLHQLDEVLRDVARRGKPGVRAMRGVLMARSDSEDQQTRLETIGMRVLRDGGLPSFEAEYPIPWRPDRRFDVAFATARLAIEWDSFRWHSQERVFQSDRERDREALEHGWRVLRFTWRDVTEDPDSVVRTVQALLLATTIRSPG